MGRACSRARLAGLCKWQAGLEIFKICPRLGPGPRTRGPGPCFMLFFCIFDNFRLKNKGKKHSARVPAHAVSCRCGPEIKFVDRDRPAAHIADSGPGPNRAGPAQPMRTSRLKCLNDFFLKIKPNP